MKKARVIKLIGGLYTIIDLETNEIHESRASGKLRYVRVDEDSPFNVSISQRTKREPQNIQISPKVGDIVYYDHKDHNKPIQQVLERKNELSRPDIANLDQILLIFSVVQPEFNFNLLDRFLVLVERANITPKIVITKIDLVSDEKLKEFKKKVNYYKDIGYELYYINGLDEESLEDIKEIFKDKVTALAGQTGVGKSTMLNALKPDLNLRTQEISRALGRGKHTTRHTELFFYGEGLIADTPGFSRLDFDINLETELKDYFIEFDEYKDGCRFRNSCNHVIEPGCNVMNNEEILKSRITNYQMFYNEIKDKKEIY